MAKYIDVDSLKRKFMFTEDGRRIPVVDVDNFPVQVPITEVLKIIREMPAADTWSRCRAGYRLMNGCRSMRAVILYALQRVAHLSDIIMRGVKASQAAEVILLTGWTDKIHQKWTEKCLKEEQVNG